MKNKRNVTIVDIANMANVTNITVSRAFNKPEQVKPETREKILSIAKQLNYVPNAFARNLKNNQSKIIGVVTNSTFNPVYSIILKKLSLMADKKGYTVMIFETNGSEEVESRAINTLFSHKASAILLSVVLDKEGYTPEYLELANTYQIPIVLFDRDIPGSNLPGVFLNNIEIGVRSGKFLAKKNHSSFLIIGGPNESEITQDRISGLLGGLRIENEHISIINSDYSYDEAYPTIYKAIQSLTNMPDCIVGINGMISMAILKSLQELGKKEVFVFSIDDMPYADVYGTKIPCISNHPLDWAEAVGKLIFDTINGTVSTRRVYIDSTLKEYD
ncbi:LacI family DNA-binding transcriptional regulator [Vibrio sp. VB16]|uniref:LacI family DNA-binding transcriptional regulator n=1 Tax=Vibrio sp. VB16 TaxID=2785746 RepID=UPI00189EBA89|nr:LacI family DNA-binding transcriptional regulator [Vibrio sp. VB16]UGA54864.1 LacI family transcriptional regulator [Vibrio sp. VB16]